MVFDDRTAEVTVDEVEEALELLEGDEIISEVSDGPLETQSVDASSIVEEVDVDPEIVEIEDEDLVMPVAEEATEGGGVGKPPDSQKT